MYDQDFNGFKNLIKNGAQLTDIEKKQLKKNKTFDEWVNLLTDKNYQYQSIYPNKKSVANHLLCVIGNGYDWNNQGYLELRSEATTDWRNAKLPENIQATLDSIFSIYEVELTYQTYRDEVIKNINKRKEEDRKNKELIDKYSKYFSDDNDTKQKYSKYYPISSTSNIYVIVDDETKKRTRLSKIDSSYVEATKEICIDILENKDNEEKDNVEFAIKAMAYFGDEKYIKLIPKKHDKYETLEELKMVFLTLLDMGNGEVTLDDTAVNQYGTNNYSVNIKFPSLKEGCSVNIEYLKDTPIFDDLMTALERVKELEEIIYFTFHYDNNEIKLVLIADDKYLNSYKNEEESNKKFEEEGFKVGFNSITLHLDKVNADMKIRRPRPTGTKKGEYFSNALVMEVVRNARTYLFQIDERGFNNIRLGSVHKDNLTDWIIKEHEEMKKSDPGYGYGKKEGSKNLYAHDFMLWLKDNQENFKNGN